PTDMVMAVNFSGSVTVGDPTYLTSVKALMDLIDGFTAQNGTVLSAALQNTYEKMPARYHDKQVIIISDGMNPAADNDDAKKWAKRMSEENIAVSAIGIYPKEDGNSLLNEIVHNGAEDKRAFYKYIETENDIDVVIKGLNNDFGQIEITGDNYDVSIRRSGEDVVNGVNGISAIGGFWYNTAKSTAQTVLTVKYFRDKGVTAFDVPLYAYWNGGGKGKVVSFLSDISSDWTAGWVYGTDGEQFLANIPAATRPDERITSPFIVEVEGSGNSTTVYVKASGSLQNSSAFTVTLTDPDGMVTTKQLTFDSSTYFATLSTDAPGRYNVHVDYVYNGLKYETDTEFSVSYYAEYDSFTAYSRSYLYRLLTESGKILELDEIKTIENTDSAYTSYTFKFTLPLMAVAAVAFVAEIIVRQLRWKDVTSFFSGLFRRRK
ncbi:MAG: VWA domain-containing protein, partial [Clostridia bacterium]|nr:VWA domain-containing protein [Clostridia bacterium]